MPRTEIKVRKGNKLGKMLHTEKKSIGRNRGEGAVQRQRQVKRLGCQTAHIKWKDVSKKKENQM
jgi:hypothetical protein